MFNTTFEIPDLLTPDEVSFFLDRVTQSVSTRSMVVNTAAKTATSHLHEARTSTGGFWRLNQDAVVDDLVSRVAAIVKLPTCNFEGVQYLTYEVGQQYKPHYDYFNPGNTSSEAQIARGGQRVATVVLYLQNADEGGGTVFPKLNETYNPRPGSAVGFWNTLDGQLNPMSLHGGEPVISGKKVVLVFWIREREFA